ncbi:MAG: hypothetical protein V1664_04610 [Candidatus Uhrbacteria bacterium]
MKVRWSVIITLGIFALILGFLIILENYPNFPDADSFYHAKMATVIRDQGFIDTFPWFQWTGLKETYINPHWLYHIFLIPFVTVFPPLVGMKVAATFFGLAAFLALYLMLRAFKVPWPWLFLVAALLSGDWLFRMAMPRAPALAIVFLFFGTWAIVKKHPRLLFFLAMFFVWFYHGWPVLVLSLLANSVAQLIALSLDEPFSLKKLFKNFIQKTYKISLATFGGLLAGLIINPYFPQNIYFSFLDIFKIGIINYQSFLPVGQEWFPAELNNLVLGSTMVIILTVVGLFFFLPALQNLTTKNLTEKVEQLFTFLLLAGGYFILTLKSVRYLEYFFPFLVIFTGILWTISQTFLQTHVWPKIKSRFQHRRCLKWLTTSLLIIFLLAIFQNEFFNLTQGNHDYFQAEQYTTATDWLKQNLPAGEVVFHNSWDFSPILWYLDDTHYYLAGLDPTFMYDYNPEIFNLWWNISCGKDSNVTKINSIFHSRVVVIDRRFASAKKFITNLETSGLFREVERNEWVSVYADYSL